MVFAPPPFFMPGWTVRPSDLQAHFCLRVVQKLNPTMSVDVRARGRVSAWQPERVDVCTPRRLVACTHRRVYSSSSVRPSVRPCTTG